MISLLLSLFIAGAQATAPDATLSLSLVESGEYLEKALCLKGNKESQKFWTWKESECFYNNKLTITSLPFRTRVGSFDVSVSKEGKAEINFNYGDGDASTGVGFWLPKKTGSYPPIDFSGGDHASGAWQARGTVQVEIP